MLVADLRLRWQHEHLLLCQQQRECQQPPCRHPVDRGARLFPNPKIQINHGAGFFRDKPDYDDDA